MQLTRRLGKLFSLAKKACRIACGLRSTRRPADPEVAFRHDAPLRPVPGAMLRMNAVAAVAEHGGGGAVRVKPVLAALTAMLAMTGCSYDPESLVSSPGDPEKPARACLAVDEATPLAMGAADRRECERQMSEWYADPWPRPDPADLYEGEEQLQYLRVKALSCRRPADLYNLTGKDRWHALMRCLVIVRRE